MPVGRKVVSLEGQADEHLAAAPDQPLALWVTCGVTRLSWPRAWPEAAGTSQPQVHLWVVSRRDLGSGRVCCPGCGNLVTRSLRQGRLSRVMLSSFIKCLLSPTSRSPWGRGTQVALGGAGEGTAWQGADCSLSAQAVVVFRASCASFPRARQGPWSQRRASCSSTRRGGPGPAR